jgi:AraC-like DNA-binding protein
VLIKRKRHKLTNVIEKCLLNHGQPSTPVRPRSWSSFNACSHIAALFSMHERTLARRLDAFGTGLRDLLNEARHDAARQMLEGMSLDVGQIAELLGYSRASVFTRAFRMWSGTTPTAWRKKRAGVSAAVAGGGQKAERPQRGRVA